LLGKEDWKTLVRRNYKLIRFDLGKVRIDGQIDGYSRTGNEPGSQSEIETDRFINNAALIVDSRYAAKRRNKATILRNRHTRNQFDRTLDRDSFETSQMSGLAEITVDTA